MPEVNTSDAPHSVHSSGPSTDTEGGIKSGTISGNVYKNAELGMTFQFPQGWNPATPESLRAINGRLEDAVKASILSQHPELAASLRVNTQKIIFYGSKRGGWDGQRLEIPSIRMTATPARLDSVDLDSFQRLAGTMANANGMKLIGPVSEFRVNKHQFVRADFERSVGAARMVQSYM